jgi:hypothetical protein
MIKIIGICGFIGSGKDTVANIIKGLYGDRVKHISFAGILKDIVSIVFGWDRALLQGDTKESRKWREEVDEWWSARLNIPGLTPRYVLQQWGTDVMRNHFHTDIWIAAVERKMMCFSPDSIVVITDCRFPNEIELINKMCGNIVWVQRGDMPHWYNEYIMKGDIPIDVHVSEYVWVNSVFNRIIKNDGELDDLRQKVIEMMDEIA